MNIQDLIIGVATNHDVLVYGLVIILSAGLGPIVAIASGILFRWDYLSFTPLYFSLMTGELIGDVVWYMIGAKLGRKSISKFGKYFGITEENIIRFEAIFHKHQYLILIISKLTTGFGFATAVLFTAGLVKIPFKRYISINLLGQFVWTGFLLAVGYWFAHLYTTFNNIFARSTLIAGALIAAFFIMRYARYLRRRIIENRDI